MYRSSGEGEYQLGVNVSIDNGGGTDNYLPVILFNLIKIGDNIKYEEIYFSCFSDCRNL